MSYLIILYRSTSGGFNNIGKTIDYRAAFVQSLR